MKRMTLIVLLAAVVAFAGQAWAGVSGSSHDYVAVLGPAAAGFGVCSSCHIPHKAVGDRLWPKPITGTSPARGDVGNLCTYCHDPLYGQGGFARTPYPFKDQQTQTHGMAKGNLPDVAGSFDTTLPYMGVAGASMQCTSCHNVHDQSLAGRLAYLQADIDVLCARCHSNRQFVNGVAQNGAAATKGAWGATRYGYDSTGAAGNPGSHPVGTDVTGDNSTHNWNGTGASADSPLTTTIMAIETYGVAGNYPLGPKLINGGAAVEPTFTGGIGCVTCHMVHGRDGLTSAAPNPDLLVFYQTEGANGAANGGGGPLADPNDALCEACHRGPAPATASGTYAGTFFPNPGAGAGTHPVDDYYLLVDAGVTGVPANWPTGLSTRADGGSPHIICESCHTPHPLQSVTRGLTNVVAPGTNSHILRNSDTLICDNCHTGTGVANHHPIGTGIMTARFSDSVIGNNDADLTCSDCHNGSGAHNWLGAGQVGLDPQWEPFNNARGTNCGCVANVSKECIDCHTNSGAHWSPARTGAGGMHGNANYQDRGEGSHFMGSFDNVNWTWGGVALNPDGNQAGTGSNFVTGVWDQVGVGAAYTGCSRLGVVGSGACVLVCESCHELEPDKNNGYGHLLLAPYTEGTATQSRSLLCEGCHSPQGTQAGTAHPQSGSTISRAVSAGRVPTTLITATTGYADAGARGDTTYPATDQMNCDSCHQPHSTVAVAGTYVLEDSAAVTSAMTGTPGVGAVASEVYYNFAAVRYAPAQASNALNFQPFCALCHNSGN